MFSILIEVDRVFVGGIEVIKYFRVDISKIEVIDSRSEVIILLFLLSGHVDDLFALFFSIFTSRASVVVGLVLFEFINKFVVLVEKLIVDLDLIAFIALADKVFVVLGFSFVGLESLEQEFIGRVSCVDL